MRPLISMIASLVNLGGPGRYIHWGFVQLSLSNFIVIVVMVVVFALAVLVPFPGHRARQK